VLSRSDDPVAEALSEATTLTVDDIRRSGLPNPVVVIDGRSGAGKSSLGARIAAAWPLPRPPQLIALDSIYPGWDGLDAGADHAIDAILRPHALGIEGAWQRWDWTASAVADVQPVAVDRGVIIEGCGILRPGIEDLASVRLWVESGETERKKRALARDGETYRPHWERWAAQEMRHIARHDPRALATRIIEVP